MKRVLCLLAVFSLIALTGAIAQTGIDGAILGVVTDANGGAVVGATVTVTNLDTVYPEDRDHPFRRQLRDQRFAGRHLLRFRELSADSRPGPLRKPI